MATSSKVKGVVVIAHCHSPLNQPKDGVTITGSSEIKWAVKGTYMTNNHCVVVVEAESSRSRAKSKVNGSASGGIFPAGKDGAFCEVTLEADEQDMWTISVATDKDETAKKELIFTAGKGMRSR